jgi:hypothetical protein
MAADGCSAIPSSASVKLVAATRSAAESIRVPSRSKM